MSKNKKNLDDQKLLEDHTRAIDNLAREIEKMKADIRELQKEREQLRDRLLEQSER